MNTQFLTFKEIMHNYYNVLDEGIQRKFEWDKDKIETFCSVLTSSASEYMANPKESDCKRDMGNIHRFEIPHYSVDYNSIMDSYYTDDGGHRLLESCMVTKAIYDVIRENNNLFNCEDEIVNEDVKAYINGLIKDIKNNFRPKKDINAFNYIMDIDKFAKINKKDKFVCEAFEINKQYFSKLLYNDIETFRDTCTFLTQTFGFVVQSYKPTTMSIRREKYNAVNNVQQPQDKLHRMASTIAEVAEKFGCTNFMIKHTEAFNILSQEYGMNASQGIEVYYYIKLSELIFTNPNVNIEGQAGVSKLANTVLNNNLGDFQYFNVFFDDIRLYGSLRGKKMKWTAIDTKENRYLSLLTASLVDIFTYSNVARMSTTSYYFYLLKNAFLIANNCQIEGMSPNVNRKKLIDLLSYIFIYKLCLTSRCDSNVASDERGVYVPLLKSIDKLFIDDEVINKHISDFKKIAFKCIEAPAYQYISTSAWSYRAKSTRFATCLISMGGQTLDECFKDASNKFFDFNGSDIDHIIPQMNSKKDKNDDNDETWKDEFSNLRLLSKVNNRSENMFTSEERFIGVDSSFPKEMHNKIFNRSCLNSRSEWIIKKIHFIVSEILNNINGVKKDVSEELSKYCMAHY